MSFRLDPLLFTGFMYALVRTMMVLTAAPPFNGPFLHTRVRIGLAASLSLVMADDLAPATDPEFPVFIGNLLMHAVIGLAFGFAIQLVLASVQMAGSLIDLFSGFSSAALYDPFTAASATPVARLFQLVTLAFLFAMNGHLLVVQGLMRSIEVDPVARLQIDPYVSALTTEAGKLLLSAAEIGLPVLASLFLAEVTLGLVARAAPQLNVLVIGFAVKTGVALITIGLAIPLISDATAMLVVRGLRIGAGLSGG
ncbi:MAG: flagellar biosynthetic protein FliR [Actinomycetia bacterium]|nr:flagellar biosynthetic protein FliR [Actinomycetes bacterium]MCP4085652.1 flagellar biosynthetic protein FliR [Actinomycetes bacterium]